MQDKLIMVSSSIITNCQLSTKMIEGIHIFGSGERADRSWVPIIAGCAYTGTALCCIMFGTEAESAIWCKILVLFSKAVIFHLFEYLQVAFLSLRIFVSVLKVKKYVLSSSCFFVLLVWDGLLRLGVCIGMSWLWCEDEWLLVVAFHFWEGCTMSTVKKSFLQKCRDFIGSSKKGKKTQPNPNQKS